MKCNIKKQLTMIAVAAAVSAPGGAALAASSSEHATAAQAVAMVEKGVAYIKAHGTEQGYAEITSKNSKFRWHDLYLVVYGLDGKVWAHGANPKMVGRDLIDLRDIDGKPFVKERVTLAQTHKTFWQDYKFTNPVTRTVQPKRMYCERLDQTGVCGGVYK